MQTLRSERPSTRRNAANLDDNSDPKLRVNEAPIENTKTTLNTDEAQKENTQKATEDLHQVEEAASRNIAIEETPKKPMPEWTKHLTSYGNQAAALFSGVAAFAHAIGGKNSKTVNFFEKTAEYCNKGSFGVNAIFNAVNGYFDKNIFNILGYSGEFLITTFMPEKIMGLARGLSFPTFQMRNILASVKAFDSPKSFSHEFEMIKERFGEAAKNLFNFSPKNLAMLTGAWGGILSALGVGTWAVTGSTKLGGLIKGIGEILVDGFQVVPLQWKLGRKFYISSGIAFIVGTICETLGRLKGDDPIFRNLYFMGSSIGRMFMTRSNTERESEYKLKPNAASA